jgi:hypothetical protein
MVYSEKRATKCPAVHYLPAQTSVLKPKNDEKVVSGSCDFSNCGELGGRAGGGCAQRDRDCIGLFE